MKEKEIISKPQMFMLFLAFITGSAIINIQGLLIGIAGNGAWVSLLIANTFGFLILSLVLILHEKYPNLSFIEYSQALVGKWVTWLIGIPLLLLLFLISANITNAMGFFFTTSMMRETPIYIFQFSILFVGCLTVKAGIEVMARMFQTLLSLIFLIVLVILTLNYVHYKPEFLLPVIPNGWKPVFHAAYVGFGFPYMDILYFTMILPYMSREKNQKFKSLMFLGLFINGIILAITIVASIMILGPIVSNEKFPLFQAARMVELGELIQRIEFIFGIALIIATYMKITMMIYIINEVMCQLFFITSKQSFIFINTLLILLLSLTIYKNDVELSENGIIMEPLLTFFIGFIPLLLLFLISLLKNPLSSSR
ncbi:GerAB/ArcD/ProY family transporter [Bacillus sp. 2205SS5-2]|uniref:GerAB/ArcD/ProY family transporter n=1 Tax=Bacillus sp. 2205SS5-2 TaxID=3109031 RepID=UPI003004C4E7